MSAIDRTANVAAIADHARAAGTIRRIAIALVRICRGRSEAAQLDDAAGPSDARRADIGLAAADVPTAAPSARHAGWH